MFFNSIVQSKTFALGCVIVAIAGCSKQLPTQIQETRAVLESKSPIVAILHATSIRQEDLWPSLVELGGQEILDDHILDLALTSELGRLGLTVHPTDTHAEKQYLETLTSEIDEESIDNLLEDKGYGHVRTSKLLWRNAALRKLIKNQVSISSEAIQRMFSIVHGPSYPARIIVVSTLEEAAIIGSSIQQGHTFSDIAIANSIDPSSSRGGRVEPISVANPIWPASIREVISDPIFIGDRWVILQVTDEPIVSNAEFKNVEPEMKRLATFAQERFLMERLAQSLLAKTKVKVIDTDLKRSSRSNSNTSQ